MTSPQTALIRQTKIFCIVAIFVFIAACSFKSLYNQLDSFIPSYIEDMVSLDDVLEKKMLQRIQPLLRWHRTTQLTEYAEWLSNLQQDVTTQLTEKALYQYITQLEYFWESLLGRINKEMADFLPSLNSEQRKELFASLSKKNQAYKDDNINIDEEERIDRYVENLHENYERWLGELTDVQKKSIEQAANKLSSIAGFRLKQRQLWQEGIQNILESNAAVKSKSDRLRTFFAGFERNKSSEMKKRERMNRHTIVKLTLNIAKSLTPDQKAYFISQTNRYIRIFIELSENR